MNRSAMNRNMKKIQIAIVAMLMACSISGCGTQPEPAVTGESFPWSGILHVEQGMTIDEAEAVTGQTYPRSGKFHNDTADLETFCTVEITTGVFSSVVSGHNGVCVEYKP